MVDAAQRSATVGMFPSALVRSATTPAGERAVFCDGLDAALDRCYDAFALPHELGLPWARPGRTVEAVAGPS